MNQWHDFNNADDPVGYALIPKGTAVKVRLSIRPGGYNDLAQGWDDNWATRNSDTGSIYLNCEFTVLEGPFARRKLWSLIGLHSSKGPEWAQMGRAFIKGILNSAHGLQPGDHSNEAQAKRIIHGLGDLDSIVFAGLVDWEKDAKGDDKAVIGMPIAADHNKYAEVMGAPSPSTFSARMHAPAATPTAGPFDRPYWATHGQPHG